MNRLICFCIAITAAASLNAAAAKTVHPFNGKDLTGWKTKPRGNNKNQWTVGAASLAANNAGAIHVEKNGKELINANSGGLDGYTEEKFGDCVIELEVFVPKGSNSGIYVMGEYEIQVFDSFGKEKLGGGDMGAIYSAAAPKVNACKKPGEWQKYVIDFRAPRFDANGKKTANAKFVKVSLNGTTLHENVEMNGPTPGGVTGKEHARGPIMFQGDHGPVAYRNIHVFPAK